MVVISRVGGRRYQQATSAAMMLVLAGSSLGAFTEAQTIANRRYPQSTMARAIMPPTPDTASGSPAAGGGGSTGVMRRIGYGGGLVSV